MPKDSAPTTSQAVSASPKSVDKYLKVFDLPDIFLKQDDGYDAYQITGIKVSLLNNPILHSLHASVTFTTQGHSARYDLSGRDFPIIFTHQDVGVITISGPRWEVICHQSKPYSADSIALTIDGCKPDILERDRTNDALFGFIDGVRIPSLNGVSATC